MNPFHVDHNKVRKSVHRRIREMANATPGDFGLAVRAGKAPFALNVRRLSVETGYAMLDVSRALIELHDRNDLELDQTMTGFDARLTRP